MRSVLTMVKSTLPMRMGVPYVWLTFITGETGGEEAYTKRSLKKWSARTALKAVA
jgi:hypothetical protein